MEISIVQEVQIMQTLSDIPELVRCLKYNPPPKAQGRSASQVCHLVMELMEVRPTLFGTCCAAHCMLNCSSTCRTRGLQRFKLPANLL